MMSAQTRIPPQYTRQFGCEELHGAFLQHRPDCGGNAAAVILPLPEGEAFFDFAMKRARRLRARVGFVCDTADQAVAALERARRALPKHRPVSIERAAAGGWGAVMSGDTLTIARAVKPRVVMAKVVHRGEHGMITDVEPSPNALLWSLEEVPVDGLLNLGDALVAAAADLYAVIVRAKPVMLIGRRAIYPDPRHGAWAAPGLEPVPRRWVGFDFDSVPYANTVQDGRPAALFMPESGAEIARRRLPPAFRDVACIIQVTASAGFKDGYRFRLWYWLNHPTTGDELKVWCKPALDRELLDPVTLRDCQPHYIGVRVVGGEDPCPQRFALLPGRTDAVRVPDIAAIKARQKQAEREERRRSEAERARPSSDTNREDCAQQRIAECIAEIGAATEAKGRHPTYVKQCATAKAICDRYGVDWSTTKSQLISAYESLFSRTDANRREKGSTLGVLTWLEGRAG